MDTKEQIKPVGSPTILTMTHPLRYLPRARHHATICSAGSKGYCAVKEMLQSGAPGHTLLIESDDLRNVENSSMECCLIYSCSEDDHHFYSHHFPSTIEHLAVYSNGACIPPALLARAEIRSVDLSPLSQVKVLQEYFLMGCSGLTTLDLRPLSQVTEVHYGFLRECTGLTILDLSPLSQVTVVQGYFLLGCNGLTTLDLSPLSQVTEVQGYFLAGCSGLTALDLSPLSQVREVSSGFLEGCSGLTTLDLSPLSKFSVVCRGFLEGCCGLTTLDLSGLSQVREIQFYPFLEGCTSLVEVISPPRCPPPTGWAVNRTMDTRMWVRE